MLEPATSRVWQPHRRAPDSDTTCASVGLSRQTNSSTHSASRASQHQRAQPDGRHGTARHGAAWRNAAWRGVARTAAPTDDTRTAAAVTLPPALSARTFVL